MNPILENLVVGGIVGFTIAIMVWVYQIAITSGKSTSTAIFQSIGILFAVALAVALIEEGGSNKPPTRAELLETITAPLTPYDKPLTSANKVLESGDGWSIRSADKGEFCGKDSIDAWTRPHPDKRTDCKWDAEAKACLMKYKLPDGKTISHEYDISDLGRASMSNQLVKLYPGAYFLDEETKSDVECLKTIGFIESEKGTLSYSNYALPDINIINP